MMEMLEILMNSRISLKIIQDYSGRAPILETPIYTLGGYRIRINDNW